MVTIVPDARPHREGLPTRVSSPVRPLIRHWVRSDEGIAERARMSRQAVHKIRNSDTAEDDPTAED